MRTILPCVVMATLLAASAAAQPPAAAAKPEIASDTIIDLLGGRLAKMFSLFGTPQNVWAQRGETEEEDDVFFSYGSYGLRVRDKTVRVCFFFKGWEAPIRGIKIGDSREDVIKVLGEPSTTVKDKDGAVTAYGYDLKDLDANFFANFDEDGKVWRVEVSLK